jgi:hypothetical protein
VKLTADNITDEQIRGLTLADFSDKDIGDFATCADLTDYALGIRLHNDIGRNQAIRIARARCAEILNTRSAK